MLKIVALISALIIGFGSYEAPQVDYTEGNSSDILVVYTNAPYAPFEYESDGEIVGIDIDICQRIADEMGVELEVLNIDFDSIIGAIAAGKGDIGAATFVITEERKNIVDFSVPYYSISNYLVVTIDSNIKSASDLKYKNVAVQVNSYADFTISDMNIEGITITRLANIDEAVNELGTKYDAILTDEITATNLASVNGFINVKAENMQTEEYALVINKNNTKLLETVNKVIVEMIADGSLAESIEYHNSASVIPQ